MTHLGFWENSRREGEKATRGMENLHKMTATRGMQFEPSNSELAHFTKPHTAPLWRSMRLSSGPGK